MFAPCNCRLGHLYPSFPQSLSHCTDEIHRGIAGVYDTGVMTVQHVKKWYVNFRNGMISLLDEERTDRPSTSRSYDDDRYLPLKQSRRFNFQQLWKQSDLSCDVAWDIVHQCLDYRLAVDGIPGNLQNSTR
ncbi:hypothetical protein AVEN_47944-1 [Araneus ventricosus]|uniref:Mos1 transposase HTH domain-containing protein n=1 Tax=Araneus ventricosus TaxID=182803 RepID=A0A4Y2DP00_ARAVE|nr:hypothetical protein AVEN_47944-1 [Araneus ventricosus]